MRLFLCGDVMVGRGIDQILPVPSDPTLHERFVEDARDYVKLGEHASGPIPRKVTPGYIWGDAIAVLERLRPDARVINLETSITTGSDFWPGKEIHYRMHPENLACLAAARIDACVLSNNHVLDFGQRGLLETISSLASAGLKSAGAGRDLSQALRPARLSLSTGGLLVAGLGSEDSGIPSEWAAGPQQPGVALLPDLSERTAGEVSRRLASERRPGELVVASIHWGANWGYHVPNSHVTFAHRLIDGGVDVVHGHSSHHPLPIEVYEGRLVLHGCGDFIDDYEGIEGYESYRSDLRLMFFPDLDDSGRLRTLRIVPMKPRRFSLVHAGLADSRWLAERLSEIGSPFGTVVRLDAERELVVEWR